MVLNAASIFGQPNFLGDITRFATVIVAKKGEGDTDDIQEGIDLLPDEGGIVVIREGTYKITSGIILNKGQIIIQGAGWGTIIQNDGFVNHIIEVTADDCTIKNLFIDVQSNDCNEAIEITGDRLIILECKIIGAGSNNIRIDGGSGCILETNTILSSANDGIELVGTGTGNIVTNNICNDNGADGIIINQDQSECTITGNIVSSNANEGIDIKGDQNIVIGNVCKSNGTDGIQTNIAADRTLISGNICLNNSINQIDDNGSNTHPNGASGTNNLALDDLNIIA